METINTALDTICYSTIINLDIKLVNKEMTLELLLTEDGKVTPHTLKFLNCSSFLWLEKTKGNNIYNCSGCAYWELSAVTLKKITSHTDDKWLKEYPLTYNVAVEIWDSAFLILASEMILDECQYIIP